MNLTPTRRSGRQRVPNKKYTNDLVDEIDFGSSEEDELPEPVPIRRRRDQPSTIDEDFDLEQVADGPEVSDERQSSAEELSEGSRVATRDDSENDSVVDILDSGDEATRKKLEAKGPSGAHSRGLRDRALRVTHRSEGVFVTALVGENTDDVKNFLKCREKWADNVTLPSQYPDQRDFGGMARPFSHTLKQRRMEATIGWDWYYSEGGKTLFETNQIMRTLSAAEGSAYLPKPIHSTQNLLMGPYGKQKLFSIPFLQSLNIDQAWSQALGTDTASPDISASKTTEKRQDGWTLNVGASLQCLEWAPNQSANTQYLAISTLQASASISINPPETAPAYTPSPGPSHIQVWRITTQRSGRDPHLPPELRLIICHEWGHAKEFKWCPTPRDAREQDATHQLNLGLLAGVFADGYVRVLDVSLDEQWQSKTSYVEYKSAAFVAKPTDAMCTCVTWLSASDIAVGCSNGYVAIWNIYPFAQADRTNSTDPIPISGAMPAPYFYETIHSTYIRTIVSAYPSHPNLVCTSSSSGYLRLTDIRSPASDYVLSARVHWAPSTIIYSAALTCFITSDEGGMIKGLPLRRFWSQFGFVKGDSEVTSLALGHVHTSVLVGFADGTLLAANLMQRFVMGRSKAMLQQKVWRHEWAPSTVDAPREEAQDETHKHRQSKGTSRITEGYKVEKAILAPMHTDLNKMEIARTGILPYMYTTTYDKQTAVRQINWNPNEAWGGWAASGMGSGLVRIENLAVGAYG
ncbi:MAG: hypothetical protein Q9191_007126 [Dirinaria sp. TL-2023a]